jgi:tetratricopeptide (TPR) repeat protein
MRATSTAILSFLFLINNCFGVGKAGKDSAPEAVDNKYIFFCQQMEDCMNDKSKPDFLKMNFDVDTFFKYMLKGMKVDPKVLSDFKKGFQTGFKLREEILRANPKYKFMQLRKRKGKTYALFRLISGGGCNYHEMLLTERNGKIKVADMYILLSGERLSKTVGRNAIPILMRYSQNAIKKFFTKQPDFIKYEKEIKHMMALYRKGDCDGGLKAYDKLPLSLKKDKSILITRFGMASMKGYNSPEYRSTISDLKKYYPKDPCLNFILIDTYFLNKDYDKVFECVANIKKFVKVKDAYLIFLEGNTYMAQGKYEEALKKQREAIKVEPQLMEPYSGLITIRIKQKNWKEVIKAIEFTEKALGLRFDRIESAPLYADFVKTEEYKNWKKSRKMPPK